MFVYVCVYWFAREKIHELKMHVHRLTTHKCIKWNKRLLNDNFTNSSVLKLHFKKEMSVMMVFVYDFS